MKTQVILVDFENVQPDLLPALNLEGTRVLVFIGPHQHKLPFAIVQAVQMLAAELKDVYFHVIAKDRDYDPLIAHLKSRKIGAAKWPSLASIPVLKRAAANTLGEQVEAVKDWLMERKANRPKTLKTLTNSLKTSAFSGRLADEDIDALLDALVGKRLIAIQGQKIEYPGMVDA